MDSAIEDKTVRFKFTRGSWDAVETHTDGADVRDRLLAGIVRVRVESGQWPRLDHMVVGWADQFDDHPS